MDIRRTLPLIAIVDDDAAVRVALARVLRSAGYRAVLHESGYALLDSLELGRPDCIVLDLNMPGIDGFGVHVELARRGLAIPVILISANHEAGIAHRAKALGARAFMNKPVDSAALIEAIEAAIRA